MIVNQKQLKCSHHQWIHLNVTGALQLHLFIGPQMYLTLSNWSGKHINAINYNYNYKALQTHVPEHHNIIIKAP